VIIFRDFSSGTSGGRHIHLIDHPIDPGNFHEGGKVAVTDRTKAYLAWGAVCFFWGTTYLAIRIGVGVLPPGLFAGLRFITAGTLLLGYLLSRGARLPGGHELFDLAVVGIALLTVANGTVVWAEQWVPSGLTALIVATLPFWIVGIESAVPRGVRMNALKAGGILIGFAGLVVLLWPEVRGSVAGAYTKGIAAVFIAPLSWGAGSIYAKYRKVEAPPLMAAAFQMLFGGAVLTFIGAVNGEFARFTEPRGIAAMGYLIAFGSIVGYGSYIYSLSNLPAALVSTYAYINPIIAVILGWAILDERLDWLLGLAASLILSGVVLVQLGARRQELALKTLPNSTRCGQ
jgi:drug/metabolite transporter (DMT)-like permease